MKPRTAALLLLSIAGLLLTGAGLSVRLRHPQHRPLDAEVAQRIHCGCEQCPADAGSDDVRVEVDREHLPHPTVARHARGGEADHRFVALDHQHVRTGLVELRQPVPPQLTPLHRIQCIEHVVRHDPPVGGLPRPHMYTTDRLAVGFRRSPDQHVLDLERRAGDHVQPRVVRSLHLLDRLGDPAGALERLDELLASPEHEPAQPTRAAFSRSSGVIETEAMSRLCAW